MASANIEDMLGKTLTKVEKLSGDDELIFYTDDGLRYRMYHEQDCCECVSIEDICGDLDSLVGDPLTMSEEINSDDLPAKDGYDESFTWTFYKLATVKGYVTIRWYGESNGYYSESVDIEVLAV